MEKSSLYLNIKESGIALENFELLSKEDYEKAVSDGDTNVYKEANKNGIYYFRTTGANNNTFLEIQFRTYKCIKLIRDIILFSLISAIVAAVIFGLAQL